MILVSCLLEVSCGSYVSEYLPRLTPNTSHVRDPDGVSKYALLKVRRACG